MCTRMCGLNPVTSRVLVGLDTEEPACYLNLTENFPFRNRLGLTLSLGYRIICNAG